MHMYVTSALQRTDMKAVGLQLALDLLHEKVCLNRNPLFPLCCVFMAQEFLLCMIISATCCQSLDLEYGGP